MEHDRISLGKSSSGGRLAPLLVAPEIASRTLIAGIVLPLFAFRVYLVLIVPELFRAPGGFGSLADVAPLFPNRSCCWRAGSTTSPSISSSARGRSAMRATRSRTWS